MTRVKIVVEGQTEESFVNSILAPTLWAAEIFLTPILLGVPGHKGGRPNYDRVKKDVLLYLRQAPPRIVLLCLTITAWGTVFPALP